MSTVQDRVVRVAPPRPVRLGAVRLSPLVSRAPAAPLAGTPAWPSLRAQLDAEAKHPRSGPARELLLLLGIMGIAAFLRFWDLGRVGFRGDEAVYAGQAAVLAGVEEMKRHFILISRGNSNFLLFQQILGLVYRLVGVADVTARVVSATFSVLTVVATFLIARVLYDRRTARYAALFLAVSSYSVALGRLALLDSTFVLLFSLSILFLAKWGRTGSVVWFSCFAATAALAIQAKVVGVLLFAVCGGYLLLSRSVGRLNLRTVLLGIAVFALFFAPALLQLARNSQEFTEFLSRSSERVSSVPWYYYLTTLVRYEGLVMTICWGLSGVAALARRSRADLLPMVWTAVIAGFYQLYPLKAFNYMLPLVPALSLLMGRAASSLTAALQRLEVARRSGARLIARRDGDQLRATDQLQLGARRTGRAERARLRRTRAQAMLMSTGVLLAVLVAGTAPRLWATLHDDSFAGLKEAAQWLADHSQPDAGVMTISHGSSQYVFAFYANKDSYPFGRFRLATVLPGGVVVNASPTADGSTPRDWVITWPPRLVESGAVSYLVYYTGPVDDPPEESQLVETATQRKFRQFVESYGGELVHTVYRNHEGRAWIYRVTKRLPKPVLADSVRRGVVKLTGRGFTESAPVTVYYHQRPVARTRASLNGSISVRFPLPKNIRPEYFLVASDSAGNSTSLTQLPPHRPSR